jgi:aldose 1-epimerase
MLTIRHADVHLVIDENDGGRAVSWQVAGHEILGSQGTHQINYGMYPMAPWAGRIRDNAVTMNGIEYSFPVNFDPWAIHGLVLTSQFNVIQHQENHLVLEREFGNDWPVAGRVRCEWILDNEGLTTEIICTSTSDAFPAVVGWHPWFRREISHREAAWTTDCNELLQRGSDALPTGERVFLDLADGPFDDVFTGGHNASIEWPGVLRVDVENSHPWFVIFDELPNFICLEPQTGPADGLSGKHTPVTMVTPDQPLVMRTCWRITRAQQPDSA